MTPPKPTELFGLPEAPGHSHTAHEPHGPQTQTRGLLWADTAARAVSQPVQWRDLELYRQAANAFRATTSA